mgnify:CR=1 FL=1
MVELFVDPGLYDSLDVCEIAHHVATVERGRLNFNLGDCVVAVRMFADAFVVQQSMAVTEVDALGDRIHVVILMV